MISLNNLANNPNMTAIANKGVFTVFEHQKDMSVSRHTRLLLILCTK